MKEFEKKEFDVNHMMNVREMRSVCEEIMKQEGAGGKPLVMLTHKDVQPHSAYVIGRMGYHGDPGEPRVNIAIRNKVGLCNVTLRDKRCNIQGYGMSSKIAALA